MVPSRWCGTGIRWAKGRQAGYGCRAVCQRRGNDDSQLQQVVACLLTGWLVLGKSFYTSVFSSIQMRLILPTLGNYIWNSYKTLPSPSVRSLFFSLPYLELRIRWKKQRRVKTVLPGNSKESGLWYGPHFSWIIVETIFWLRYSSSTVFYAFLENYPEALMCSTVLYDLALIVRTCYKPELLKSRVGRNLGLFYWYLKRSIWIKVTCHIHINDLRLCQLYICLVLSTQVDPKPSSWINSHHSCKGDTSWKT